jgi:excisionase family DNA binding protein
LGGSTIATKTKYFAILPLNEDPCGPLSAIIVPRLMRIQDAAQYLGATTWQVETLLREKAIPSFVLGKRRVVDRLELDRYVERRNALARTETPDTTEHHSLAYFRF